MHPHTALCLCQFLSQGDPESRHHFHSTPHTLSPHAPTPTHCRFCPQLSISLPKPRWHSHTVCCIALHGAKPSASWCSQAWWGLSRRGLAGHCFRAASESGTGACGSRVLGTLTPQCPCHPNFLSPGLSSSVFSSFCPLSFCLSHPAAATLPHPWPESWGSLQVVTCPAVSGDLIPLPLKTTFDLSS